MPCAVLSPTRPLTELVSREWEWDGKPFGEWGKGEQETNGKKKVVDYV